MQLEFDEDRALEALQRSTDPNFSPISGEQVLLILNQAKQEVLNSVPDAAVPQPPYAASLKKPRNSLT